MIEIEKLELTFVRINLVVVSVENQLQTIMSVVLSHSIFIAVYVKRKIDKNIFYVIFAGMGHCSSLFCRKFVFDLFIYDPNERLPVRKLFRNCRLCGHGGHINCFEKWFNKHDRCVVAACDCKCKLKR